MISKAFILCSVLLITGTLAYPKVASEPKEYLEAFKKAGIALFADIMSSKNIANAFTDRGLEATASLDDELSSAAKSALKRIKELQDGGSLEDALTKVGQAILKKGAKKFKKVGDFLSLFNDDSLKGILENGAKAMAKLMKKVKA